MIGQTKEGWWILPEDLHLMQVEKKLRLDWDQGMLQALKPYIPIGGCVIDIGASIGTHTCFYLDVVGPTGTVVAIEPGDESFECLVRNCPSARCYHFALGAEYGFCSMIDNPQSACMNQIVEHDEGYTRMVPLDAFWETIQLPVDFIKLDAEGYELFILRGGRNLIKRYRPVMVVEINNYMLLRYAASELEIRDFFKSMNYKVDILPQGWCDLLCLP